MFRSPASLAWLAGALALVGCASESGDPALEEARHELTSATFRCGAEWCSLHREYCLVTWSDNDETSMSPATYSCESIPADCTDVTACACIGSSQCFEDKGRVVVAAP